MAVAAARRRADCDEHGVGIRDRAGELGREFQPAGARCWRTSSSRPGS